MILRNFAVFEGIDGTGTTTQLSLLSARIPPERAWFTCEPTPGEIGRLVRRALRGEINLAPDTLARLFAADRSDHLYGPGGVIAQIEAGKAVFSDRYLFSSLAYQGETLSDDLAVSLNRDFPLPEVLLFFDLDAEAAMGRVERRGEDREIYETIAFQRRVRDRYRDIVARFEREEPEMRVVRVDASEPIEEIARKVWSAVGNLPIH